MIIKLKQRGVWGSRRTASIGKIDDILVRQNLLAPEKERIHIFFRGPASSGIVELNAQEAESLMNSLKNQSEWVRKNKLR